jgi:hypothetical protein
MAQVTGRWMLLVLVHHNVAMHKLVDDTRRLGKKVVLLAWHPEPLFENSLTDDYEELRPNVKP